MIDDSTVRQIRTAIVPAAGLGTRLRPLTSAIPKEMLPLGRGPVLGHVLDELRSARIEHVVIVVSPAKEMIRSYFGGGEERGLRIEYVVQPEMRGLGDAVLRAEPLVRGQVFAVAFGDCLIEYDARRDSPLARMIQIADQEAADAVALAETVPADRVSRYGILQPVGNCEPPAAPFRIADIVEKPALADAPSRLAVAARWILSPSIFDCLRATPNDGKSELSLTDAVRILLGSRDANVWAVPLDSGERRVDIGGWDTYLAAAADYAMRDPEHGAGVRSVVCRGGRA